MYLASAGRDILAEKTLVFSTQQKIHHHLGRAARVVGARAWSNSGYAGRVYDKLPPTLRERFPAGVLFSYEGFPMFARYAVKTVRLGEGFRGPTRKDTFSKANQIFGWTQEPKGLIWHTCEDGVTMLLIDSRLHAIGHWGGVRVAKQMGIWETPQEPAEPGEPAAPGGTGTPCGPIDETRVAAAEHQLGTTFPDAYRRFLLGMGGTNTSTTVPNTGGGYLRELYDTDELIEWNTVMRTFGFPSYVPADYLIVGGGSGGAPCIRLTGADVGSVWWANFDKAGAFEIEEPHDQIMDWLANDFDDFLALFE